MIDEHRLSQAHLVIVDDEKANRILLTRILERAGFEHVVSFSDPCEALAHIERAGGAVDLVLTDLHMPHLDGLELTRCVIASRPAGDYLPIIVLSADTRDEAQQQALSLGAHDFLTKPFQAAHVLLRARNLLQTRFLHLDLKAHNCTLEQRVRERTIELETARSEILERLALAAEYRDSETGRHTQRVGVLAEAIALELGVSEGDAELLRRAAPLHDVGKIGIPDEILLKPGKLTQQEFETMKGHVSVGVELLSRGQSELIRLAELIALTHHEHFDGSGYPRGLKGDAIPLAGQIVAVADVFDTLISRRPYKEAWPVAEAIAEIEAQRRRWFSPRVVDAFLRALRTRPDLVKREAEAALP